MGGKGFSTLSQNSKLKSQISPQGAYWWSHFWIEWGKFQENVKNVRSFIKEQIEEKQLTLFIAIDAILFHF